jgi:hypothetical protein
LEIVTVALDANVEAARRVVERVAPDHPSLIDAEHRVDALFGIFNVPMGVWIDERGMIVRPAEPAFPARSATAEIPISDQMPQRLQDMLIEARKIRTDPQKYTDALRDWVALGAASRFALTPNEVVQRSRPRPVEVGLAAAHFELGAHFHANGKTDGAIRHWREAHRLQPDNWTYKRQAWSLADPMQGPTDIYEGDWLSDVRTIGAENYYPPLEM